jgi:hypothetical protein
MVRVLVPERREEFFVGQIRILLPRLRIEL